MPAVEAATVVVVVGAAVVVVVSVHVVEELAQAPLQQVRPVSQRPFCRHKH